MTRLHAAIEEAKVSGVDMKGVEEEEAKGHLIVLCAAKMPVLLREIANTTKWQECLRRKMMLLGLAKPRNMCFTMPSVKTRTLSLTTNHITHRAVTRFIKPQ